MNHYVGQRLSLKSQACTVRYIGPVSGKANEWLGVEWDDTSRGKHDGRHDGTRYFECRVTESPASSEYQTLRFTGQAEVRLQPQRHFFDLRSHGTKLGRSSLL